MKPIEFTGIIVCSLGGILVGNNAMRTMRIGAWKNAAPIPLSHRVIAMAVGAVLLIIGGYLIFRAYAR
jgi:hypothetical protein